MAKNNVINANGNKDSMSLIKVFESIKAKALATGMSFGESVANVSKDSKTSLVDMMAREFFAADSINARGEAGAATNSGISSAYRSNFISGLKSEYAVRAKDALVGASEAFHVSANPSQQYGIIGSHLPTTQQLLLLALAPAVIKPIHNKVVKSIVTKGLSYERVALAPYFSDEAGNTYDFYDVVNSNSKLLTLGDGGQLITSVEIPMDQGKIKGAENFNICEVYNRIESAKNPENFKAIKSIFDFVSRGVEITGVKIKDGANEKLVPVTYVTTGNATQSGQVDDTVASINLKLYPTIDKDNVDLSKPLEVIGKVSANGNILLVTTYEAGKNDGTDKKPTITGVVFKFFIPAKGAENPLKVHHRETTLVHYIKNKTAFATTLNNQLIEDYQTVLNKDLIAKFNETSVEATNAKKDVTLIDYLNTQINKARQMKTLVNKYENIDTVLNRQAEFAYRSMDMTVQRPGMTDFLHGHNISLAKAMFDTCNDIDVALNPEIKRFSVISSSSAAQWVKDQSRQDVTRFNLLGEATEEGNTVGGIITPYSLQSISMGNLYNGTYITTNRIKSGTVIKDVIDDGGATKKVEAKKHRFTILPRFEENMDATIFLHGLERITEGVYDVDFYRDKTLQYETRYDIVTYNQSIGVVDFTEAPTNSEIIK